MTTRRVPISEANIQYATTFVGVSLALAGFTTLLVIIRIWTRLQRPVTISWDDYFIAAATVLALIDTALLVATADFVFGAPALMDAGTRDSSRWSTKLGVISQPVWAWCMFFIKFAVGFMLLRVSLHRPLRIIIYASLFFVTAGTICCTVSIAIQCIPYRAYWEKNIPGAKCLPGKVVLTLVYSNLSMNIASDFIFSLLPIAIIRVVRRPLREKLAICILMGLGILAGVASIIKLMLGNTRLSAADPFRRTMELRFFSVLEYQLSLLAACVPSLRRPFLKLVKRVGISWGIVTQTTRRYYHSGAMTQRRTDMECKTSTDEDRILEIIPSLPSTRTEEV